MVACGKIVPRQIVPHSSDGIMSEINAGSTQKRSNQLSLNVGSAYETYAISGSICDCDMIISIPGIATDE